jgi:hypothetical protein
MGLYLLMMCAAAQAEGVPPTPAPSVRKPKVSWTLQFGLAHSADGVLEPGDGVVVQARLAFVKPAERVLTSPNGCGVSNRTEPHCNEYIKQSLKTLDTILFPSFRGDRGIVRFVAAALTVKGIGARLEAAQLNTGGSRVNASGLRFGFTVR